MADDVPTALIEENEGLDGVVSPVDRLLDGALCLPRCAAAIVAARALESALEGALLGELVALQERDRDP